MENLIEQLKNDAISKGICEAWQNKFTDNMSIEELVKMYIKGIDFCISEDYPTLEFMKSKFKGICEPYGVFIDETVLEVNKPDIVLNGSCEASLWYWDYTVSRLYVRHNSIANLNVLNNALVTIDVYDNSVLNIIAVDNCKIIVTLYGNSKANISKSDNVKVITKVVEGEKA